MFAEAGMWILEFGSLVTSILAEHRGTFTACLHLREISDTLEKLAPRSVLAIALSSCAPDFRTSAFPNLQFGNIPNKTCSQVLRQPEITPRYFQLR
jgi:hypothetical protein